MKGTGETVDGLEKRQKILQQELAASGEKVELLNNKLQSAKNIFGENSVEASRWNAALNDAKNAQETIAQELSDTTAKLDAQKAAESEMSAEAQAAAEKLRQQAEAQEKLRSSLEQADTKIKQFDQELELNSTKLEGSKDKTDLLKERQKLLAGQSQEVTSKTKILEDALDACGKEVGENSEEYAELKSNLTDAKIKQAEIQNEIKNTTEELKNQKTTLQTVGEGFGKFGEGAEHIGQSLKGASTAAAGALTGAGAAAISFESAFAGVKKTSDEVFDANGKCVYSYQQLEDGIRSMAKEIPASTTEIAEVAETAGQLGIKTQDVLAFTRVMIDMGNSTNLAAEDAATSIAKFANVTGLAADTSMTAEEKYQKTGSTIVDLGNNYATTEADIMNMATNLASAGAQVGMSESDILALATALSSVGMEAQAGGTAFSKALIQMQLAVETNSDSLKDWADVAGMSVEEFSTLFKEDATSALEAFIKGLSECGGETDSAIKVLDDMGITETRMRDALLRSANASDVFTSAIQTGKNAWEDNTALTNEASKRYETTASQLSIMKNNIYDVGITLGSTFLPKVSEAVQKVNDFAEKIAGLSDGQQKAILGIAAFVAVLSPLLIFIGKVSTGISAVISVGSKLAGIFAGAGAAATEGGAAMAAGSTVALGPIALVVAAIAAVVAILVVLWNKSDEFRENVTNAIGVLKDTISGFLDNIGFSEKLESIKTAAGELGDKIGGLSNLFSVFGVVVAAIAATIAGALAIAFDVLLRVIEPIITVISGIVDALAGLGDMIVGIFTGDTDLAKQGLELFAQGIDEIVTGILDFVAEALAGLLEGAIAFGESLLEALGLDEVVDTIAEAVDSAVDTVTSVFDTIGNVIAVGVLTIESIISAAAQIIAVPFQFIWYNCHDTIVSVWDSISEKIQSVIDFISGIIQSGFSLINTYIVTPVSEAYTSVASAFESIRSTIASKVDSAKSAIQNGFSLVQSYISAPISQAYSTVSSTFERIRSTIASKIDGAKSAVKNGIDKIKGFFNFSWSLPKLKLPHFKITGSFSLVPPSAPKFDVDWYAKGAIFKQATLIPTYSGLKGVGEAGEEAVAPIALLRSYISDEMERVMMRMERVERDPIDYGRLADEMAKRKVVVEYKGREFGRIIEEVIA